MEVGSLAILMVVEATTNRGEKWENEAIDSWFSFN